MKYQCTSFTLRVDNGSTDVKYCIVSPVINLPVRNNKQLNYTPENVIKCKGLIRILDRTTGMEWGVSGTAKYMCGTIQTGKRCKE